MFLKVRAKPIIEHDEEEIDIHRIFIKAFSGELLDNNAEDIIDCYFKDDMMSNCPSVPPFPFINKEA